MDKREGGISKGKPKKNRINPATVQLLPPE